MSVAGQFWYTNQVTSRRTHLALLLLALCMLAAGCRRGEPPKPQVNEQGVLQCSETCADHGQCGTLPNAKKAVLANDGGPAVSFHDRYFADKTSVLVVEINDRELLPANNGVPLPNSTPYPHQFYRVSVPDGTMSWVSAWCIVKTE